MTSPPPPWGKAVGFPKAASTPPSQEKNLFLFLNTYRPIFPPLIEKDRGSTCVIVASFSLVNENPEKENRDPAGKSCRPQQAGEIPTARAGGRQWPWSGRGIAWAGAARQRPALCPGDFTSAHPLGNAPWPLSNTVRLRLHGQRETT